MGEVAVVRMMVSCSSVQEPRIIRRVCGHHRILVAMDRVAEWLFWIVGVQSFLVIENEYQIYGSKRPLHGHTCHKVGIVVYYYFD